MTDEQRAMSNKRVARWKARNPEKNRKQGRESARRSYAVDPEPRKRAVRKWLSKNKACYGATRRRTDLAKYGLTEKDYQDMLVRQDGRCAICGTTDPGSRVNDRLGGVQHWPVDHCHDTGKVRGLLCSKCNAGIAMLQHDRRILALADSYLMRAN